MKYLKIAFILVFSASLLTNNVDATTVNNLKQMTVHFIYVGQGDATYLKTPNG